MIKLAAHCQYTIDQQTSFVYINGTSTMHDWTAKVNEMNGKMSAVAHDGLHINSISNAEIQIKSSSLKSGKQVMDENIYKALKVKQYPNINFKLTGNKIINGEIIVNGKLTIAGVTKEIKTIVTHKELDNEIIICGKVDLKMTDFNVIPPKFLKGLFTTGDKIEIVFYFTFCDINNKCAEK